MNLCVIPARGGSKRIPRKNVKDFLGKPMIARSIEIALKAGCFDDVIVSTDDAEIAEIAVKLGAKVPFIRPGTLSTDYTPTIPVIKHAVQWFDDNVCSPDYVCCLYATAPFVRVEDILFGLKLLLNEQADYAISLVEYSFPIQRAVRLGADNIVKMLDSNFIVTRSQDLEKTYHDAGQFYWGTRKAWINEIPIFDSHAYSVLIPSHRAQDIDTLEDWARAEILYKVLHDEKKN
jgi:pseudaminic acid cytidylyltransferase